MKKYAILLCSSLSLFGCSQFTATPSHHGGASTAIDKSQPATHRAYQQWRKNNDLPAESYANYKKWESAYKKWQLNNKEASE